MSGTSPGTFDTSLRVPAQLAPVEMQSLDGNEKKINVQINPQPMVTAETLQTFNKNFLNDLHRLKKRTLFVPPIPKNRKPRAKKSSMP